MTQRIYRLVVPPGNRRVHFDEAGFCLMPEFYFGRGKITGLEAGLGPGLDGGLMTAGKGSGGGPW